MFIFISPAGTMTLAMIHTDDIDAVGQTDEDLDFIFDILDQIWKVKVVPSDYILGVHRRIKYDDNKEIEHVEMTMTPYIEGMAEVSKDHLPTGVINTPFPEKVQLLKGDADEAETKMINDCGFMRAVRTTSLAEHSIH